MGWLHFCHTQPNRPICLNTQGFAELSVVSDGRNSVNMKPSALSQTRESTVGAQARQRVGLCPTRLGWLALGDGVELDGVSESL
jgi:hypothetical protein